MVLSLRATHMGKRVTLFATAFVLAVSSLSAIVPFLTAQTAGAVSGLVYQGIPSAQPANYDSVGFAANSAKELGQKVELAGSNRLLDDVTLSFSSWACETGGWNTNNCVTSDGSTYNVPVTVNIYAVGAGDTVGSLLATTTETVNAPYRPSADNVNCGTTGKWYDTASATCNNGKAFDSTFSFASQYKVLPNEVIVSVAYNTSHAGYAPTGVSGPADSFNVSLTPSAPALGTNNNDVFYWNSTIAANYTDGGAAGTGTFRADTGWSPYRLAVNLSANAVPTTTACTTTSTVWSTNLNDWTSAPVNDTRASGHNEITGDGIHVYTDDATSAAKATGYKAVDYPLSANGNQTIANSFEWVQNSGSTGPGLQLVVDFNNDGTPDGILVGEVAYTGDNWWLSNSASQFVKDNSPNVGGGYGSSYYGTLDQWLTKFPTAQVKYVGYSLGSGVHADGVLKSMTFGCTVYKFDNQAPAQPVHQSPVADAVQTSNNFWFDWSDAAGATHYEIQNSTNPSVDPTTGSFTNVQWTGDYTHTQPTESKAQSVGANGTWYWQVRALDDAGNASAWTQPWKVTIDTVAPTGTDNLAAYVGGTVTVTQHIDDNYAPKSGKMRIWKLTDAGAQDNTKFYSSAVLNVNGSGDVLYTLNTKTNLFGDGKYVVKFTATDQAGNETISSQHTFTVDNTRPTATITSPVVNGTYGKNLTITGTANDANGIKNGQVTVVLRNINTATGSMGSNIATQQATVNGDGTWSTVFDVSGLDGTKQYGVQALVYDTAGNESNGGSGKAVKPFNIDVISPIITSTTANGATVHGVVDFSVDDPDAVVTVNGTETTATQVSGDGTYTVIATDVHGNQSDPFTFTIDNSVETAAIIVSDPNSPTPTVSGTVTYVADGAAFANGDLTVTVDGVAYDVTTDGDGDWALTLAGVENGDHTVSVRVAGATTTLASGTFTTQLPENGEVNGATDTNGDGTTGTQQIVLPTTTGDVLGVTDTSSTETDSDSDVAGDATSPTDTLAQAVNNTDGKAFGFAWYWWLIIAAGVAIIFWWIVAAIRRRQANDV